MTFHAEIRAALERQRRHVDADVVEELAQHAAASFEHALAEGASAEDAHTRVSALIDGWCASGARRLRPRRTPIIEPPVNTGAGWIGVGRASSSSPTASGSAGSADARMRSGRPSSSTGQRYRVVAVMPKDFAFPTAEFAAWMPMRVTPVIDARNPDVRAISLFRGIARLSPARPRRKRPQTARRAGVRRRISAWSARRCSARRAKRSSRPHCFSRHRRRTSRPRFRCPVGALALLLFVAVANIAGVQLARVQGPGLARQP